MLMCRALSFVGKVLTAVVVLNGYLAFFDHLMVLGDRRLTEEKVLNSIKQTHCLIVSNRVKMHPLSY